MKKLFAILFLIFVPTLIFGWATQDQGMAPWAKALFYLFAGFLVTWAWKWGISSKKKTRSGATWSDVAHYMKEQLPFFFKVLRPVAPKAEDFASGKTLYAHRVKNLFVEGTPLFGLSEKERQAYVAKLHREHLKATFFVWALAILLTFNLVYTLLTTPFAALIYMPVLLVLWLFTFFFLGSGLYEFRSQCSLRHPGQLIYLALNPAYTHLFLPSFEGYTALKNGKTHY